MLPKKRDFLERSFTFNCVSFFWYSGQLYHNVCCFSYFKICCFPIFVILSWPYHNVFCVLDRLRLFNKRLRSEFVLLCPEGGSAPVEQYSTCNWGEVKANLLMVPAHSERKKEITQLVEKGEYSQNKDSVENKYKRNILCKKNYERLVRFP